MAVLSRTHHARPAAAHRGVAPSIAYKPGLERRFKFTSRFGEEVSLCRVDPDAKVIYLPRGVCPVGEVDERDWGDPVEFPKAPAPARLSGPAVRRDDRLPQGRPVGRRLRLYRVRQDGLGLRRRARSRPQDPRHHDQGRHLPAVDRRGEDLPRPARPSDRRDPRRQVRGRRHRLLRRHDPFAVEGRQVPRLDRQGLRPRDFRRVP